MFDENESELRSVLLASILLATAFSGCLGSGENDLPPEEPSLTQASGGFSETDVFSGTYNTSAEWSQPLREGPHEIQDPEIVSLESDVDGAQLEIGHFRPAVPEGLDVPVIAVATPYLFGGMSTDSLRNVWIHDALVETLVPHGYSVAIVPVRGTADNGGCADVMGPKERADLDQAVTWLGTQNWSNGNVGMFGKSYDGATAWEVASTGNPHLATIVPVSGINNLYHLFYDNGTRQGRGVGSLIALQYAYGVYGYDGRSPERSLQAAVCPESWEGLASSAYTFATTEHSPSGFWEERNLRPGVEANYSGSILLAQGLQDPNVDPSHAYPWVRELETQGITVKHLLGQWGHDWPDWVRQDGEVIHPREDWREILLHWFDYWLKGNTSRDLGPRVQVQDSSGSWRSTTAWPPEGTNQTTVYIQPGGNLRRAATSDTSTVTLVPRNDLVGNTVSEGLEAIPGHPGGEPVGKPCDIGACFQTPPLNETLRFAGNPIVNLTVTPTGPGGHVETRLYAVDVDGDLQRVGAGQLDLRFAHGGDTARAVTPGEPMEVPVWLEPLDAVIEKGDRLMLRISQSSYGGHTPSVPTYPIQVHLGDGQSVMTLDTFDRDPSAFFDPPGGVGTR